MQFAIILMDMVRCGYFQPDRVNLPVEWHVHTIGIGPKDTKLKIEYTICNRVIFVDSVTTCNVGNVYLYNPCVISLRLLMC